MIQNDIYEQHQVVKNFIARFRSKYGLSFPYKLARDHNIHVKHAELPEDLKGLAIIVNNQKYIVLNNNLNDVEKKMVTSYQFVHHLLGRKVTKYLYDTDMNQLMTK